MKAIILLSAVLVVGACATAKDRYREDGFRFLSGAEIEELVSGNTVQGRYVNRVGLWTDYHLPDGRVVSREADGVHYGTWAIQGDEICYTYPDKYPEAATPLPSCVEVGEKEGRYVNINSTGRYSGQLGGQWIGVQPGNSKDLPLE
jgi:hypothetical protein